MASIIDGGLITNSNTTLTGSTHCSDGIIQHQEGNRVWDNSNKIKLPETFCKVISKSFPELSDIKTVGYQEIKTLSSFSFEGIFRYQVGIELYFKEVRGDKKTKDGYEYVINDLLKMSYPDFDFVTFRVQSLIFPPEKTNRDKFFELFGDM